MTAHLNLYSQRAFCCDACPLTGLHRSKRAKQAPLRKDLYWAEVLSADRSVYSTGARLIAARRHSQIGASTSYSSRSETALPAQDASQYYSALAAIARRGDYDEAERLLQEMVSAGHELTPRAYHGLIFSCVRGGNKDAALDVWRAEMESGVQPVAESYAVVIYACIMGEDFEGANEVYNALSSAAVDRKPAWMCMLSGLTSRGLLEEDTETKAGLITQIEEMLEQGRLEGWYPDADLYEKVLGLLCEDPKTALVADRILHEDLVMRDGVEPEVRHYNCLLRAEAIWMGVHNARNSLQEMIEGKKGAHVRPNIESYNALLEGCLIERMQGFSYAHQDIEGVIAELVTIAMQMNKRTHTLTLMFYLLDDDLDRVIFELREIERLSAPGQVLHHLSDEWLTKLILFLLHNKCVLEVLQLLFIMEADSREMPVEASLLDEDGRSFFTRWLPEFFAGQHMNRRTAGLAKYQEDPEGDVFVMDDTWINQDNVAVSEDSGTALNLSDMTANQMKAELEAKGLSSSGLKRDLSRRVQASRGSQPRSVKEEMQRRRAELLAKQAKDNEREAEKVVIKSMNVVERYVDVWDHFKMVNRYTETFVVDPKQSDREEDAKNFETLNAMDLPESVKSLLKQQRRATSKKDIEAMYMLDSLIFDTDTPEFKAVNPNFEGREGYGTRMTWPSYGQGARLAWHMMEIAQSLGAGVSLWDFVEMSEACIEERDEEAAVAVMMKMRPYAPKVDPQVLEVMYSKALLLCMQARRMELVHLIAEDMQSLNLQPVGVISKEGILPELQQLATEILEEGSPPDETSQLESPPADPSEDEAEDPEDSFPESFEEQTDY